MATLFTLEKLPMPGIGSFLSVNQIVSEAKCHMVGHHEECRKTVAKENSRNQPPGIGAFVPGQPLGKSIHHQGNHEHKAGP